MRNAAFDCEPPHSVLIKVKKAYRLTNGDMRVGKHAQLGNINCVFMCFLSLSSMQEESVSVVDKV